MGADQREEDGNRLPGKLVNLGSYVAAVMASTGLLALAPGAEAKIVFARTHKTIPDQPILAGKTSRTQEDSSTRSWM